MMKAIQIERFGKPSDVLQVVDVPDVGAPAVGEVVIAVETSPINQYDLLMIAGGHGYRPACRPSWARKELAADIQGNRRSSTLYVS
jgi:NADPH:quinone reductase-like Zn-dependent oxidoreductase